MLVYMCPNCGWLYLPKDYCEDNPFWPKGEHVSGYIQVPEHDGCNYDGTPVNAKDGK